MKKLYTIKLAETKGKETIARADDVFNWIDSDFETWGTDKKGEKKAGGNFEVYEMDKNSMFKEIFDSLSSDTNSLTLTQEQIISFCKEHKDKLRENGYATFFLFKVGEEFFVASVYVNADGLEVFVHRFSYVCVWDADGRHRIVVPQLAPTHSAPSSSESLILIHLEKSESLLSEVKEMLK